MEERKRKNHPAAERFYHWFDKLWDLCIGIALGAVLIIVLIQILMRVFEVAVPWTEESSRYAFIWMMFIGVALSMRKADAARVTVLVNHLPQAGKKICRYLYIAVSAAFFIFMLISGAELVGQQIDMNEVGTAVLMPMWLIGISLPVSGILGLVSLTGSLLLDPELLEGGGTQ